MELLVSRYEKHLRVRQLEGISAEEEMEIAENTYILGYEDNKQSEGTFFKSKMLDK